MQVDLYDGSKTVVVLICSDMLVVDGGGGGMCRRRTTSLQDIIAILGMDKLIVNSDGGESSTPTLSARSIMRSHVCLQCFDAVGWAAGRASCL